MFRKNSNRRFFLTFEPIFRSNAREKILLIGLADAVGEDEEGVDAVNNSEKQYNCSVITIC